MSFYFSATPVFTPQTYEEMVKPLDKYNEAYEKVESQLVDLQDKTQYWADRVQDSPVAKQMYEYYNNKLQQLSDDFAKGMTSGNRAKLIEMHRDYSKTMGALENQWKAKEEFLKERKEKGNDYIYGVYENPNYVEGGDEPAYLDEVNMDMFANGRKPTTRGLNLDKYTKDIATDVSLFSDSVDATLGKDIKTEDGQMILRNIKNGQLTQEDVLTISDIMKGLTDGSINEKTFKETEDERAKIYYTYAKILTDHINNDTYFPYMSTDNRNKIMEATERGLFAGLQKNDGKLYNNAEYLSAKDKWNQWIQSQQLAISRANANNENGVVKLEGTDADGSTYYMKGSTLFKKDKNGKWSKVGAEGTVTSATGRTSIPLDINEVFELTEKDSKGNIVPNSKLREYYNGESIDGANIHAGTMEYDELSKLAKQLGTTIDNIEIVKPKGGSWEVRVKGTGSSSVNDNATPTETPVTPNKEVKVINTEEGL